MININYTLLVQAGIFILFVYLINQLVFRPILKALDRRREATVGAQERALALQEKARSEEALLKEKLAEARSEAAREKARIRAKITAEQREILDRARDTINKDIPALRDKLMSEMKEVEAALKKEVEPFARRMAEKVLGRAA